MQSHFTRLAACLVMATAAWIPASAQSAILAGGSDDNFAQPTPSRVVERLDEARVITLAGDVHPLARPDFDRGPVAPGKLLERIVMVLKRSPEQEAALGAFNERQYDPKSADFHHWLHADEFGKLYGPSDADMAAVTNWLQNRGFRIDLVSKGRVTIQFTGTVAQVNDAFHVEMHNYLVDGKMHIANDRSPQIPVALAPGRHRSGFAAQFLSHALFASRRLCKT